MNLGTAYDFFVEQDKIIEMKYDEFMPEFILQLLELENMQQIAYSKYRFKNSVLEAIGAGKGLSAWTVVIILAMAGLPLIVAVIMIAMQSNLLVSLGMVGALSIVRFRNAVKNPIDLLYLFWSISVGIIVGIGLYLLGIVLSILMTLLLLVLNIVPNGKTPELLVLRSMELSSLLRCE